MTSRDPSPRGARSAIALVMLVLALGASARAEPYKDEALGFSLVAPKGWRTLPIAGEEHWMAAHFQSDREYWPKRDFGMMHRPEIRVVLLPLPGAASPAPPAESGPGAPASYKDFHEYLAANAKGMFDSGGFYFSAEGETTIRGMKVIQYEITFEKLTDSPRRVYGWAFYAEDCIYGLMGDCLIAWEKKLKADILSSFRSFRVLERSGTLPWLKRTGTEAAPAERPPDGAARPELTEEEIQTKREDLTAREVARIEKDLPGGWKIVNSRNFIAVTHADPRYTKKLLDHAEALRAWLDDTLGFVGSGYVGKIILRICEDEHESEGYQSSIPWSSFGRIEVVTYKDKEGWSDWAMESLNGGIYSIWIRERNPDFLAYAPRWIELGLSSFVENARSQRGKVVFDPDTWDSVSMMELRRGGKLIEPRQFFELSAAELSEKERTWQQSEAFVRFLLVGSASRSSKYRSILADTIKNLIFLVDEAATSDAGMKDLAQREPQTEQEEEALVKKRREAWGKAEQDRLESLRERTFEGWTDADWQSLNAAYVKEMG